MTIDKAIEIKLQTLKDQPLLISPDFVNADKLSIEALYRCQEIKSYTPKDTYCPLPGEEQ